MKLAIFSDSHYDEYSIRRAAAKLTDDIAFVIHLGDMVADARLLAEYTNKPLYRVCGNCDLYGGEEVERLEPLLGVNVFMCHGHCYHVKQTNDLLVTHAREVGAQLALFGHTHRPFCGWEQGVLLVNPGALHQGSYATVEIEDGRMQPDLLTL